MSKNLVYVGPAGDNGAKPLIQEGVALSAATLPGTLVKSTATGIQTSAALDTDFGQLPLFANKNEMQTKLMTDAWTQNENMVAVLGRSGEFLNVLVATGQAITVPNTALASNGDGTLKIAAVDGTDKILAYADEIITTAAVTLVRVVVAP